MGGIPHQFSGREKNSARELWDVSSNADFFQGLSYSCKLDFEMFLLVIMFKDI